MPAAQPWPSDWLRGVLELIVLRAIAATPSTYGYAISVALEEQGFGIVKGGTLYPLLARLEDSRYVTTQWRAGEGGPGRKYYTVTDTGREHLEAMAAQWSAFAARTGALLGIPSLQPD
jgi:PadR family transcriptional regulator PadR